MKSKWFRNKDNSLSLYGLACGYCQDFSTNNRKVQLYQDGCYQVRVFDYGRDFSAGFNDISGGRFWFSYTSLTEAKKVYNKIAKLIRLKNFDVSMLECFINE